MSEHLIGFGADLQQKLDAMHPKRRRTRWAGDIGIELYNIARKLQRLNENAFNYGTTPADERKEKRLMERARAVAAKLGEGVEVYHQPDSRRWPLYVVFPGDVPKGSGPETVFEQGVAVPPRP